MLGGRGEVEEGDGEGMEKGEGNGEGGGSEINRSIDWWLFDLRSRLANHKSIAQFFRMEMQERASAAIPYVTTRKSRARMSCDSLEKPLSGKPVFAGVSS